MKELSLHQGGHPYKIDDLLHLQAGTKETFILLLKGLGISIAPNTVVIVSGCDIIKTFGQGGSIIGVALNDGLIYYNEELYVVKANGEDTTDPITNTHQNLIQGNLSAAYLQIQEVVLKYDGYNEPPNNEVDYEEGSYNVHIEKRMFLTKTSTNNINLAPNNVEPKTLREYIESGSGTSSKSAIFGNTNSITKIASKDVDLLHKRLDEEYVIYDSKNFDELKPNIIDTSKTNVVNNLNNPSLIFGLKNPLLTTNLTNGIVPLNLMYGFPTPLDAKKTDKITWDWNFLGPNPISNLFGNSISRTNPNNSNPIKYGFYSLAFFGIISWNYAQFDKSWGSQIIHGKPIINSSPAYSLEVIPNGNSAYVELPGVYSSIIKQSEMPGTALGEDLWYFFIESTDGGTIFLKWEHSGVLSIISQVFRQVSIVGHLYFSYNISSL